jgi:hypothetical protein
MGDRETSDDDIGIIIMQAEIDTDQASSYLLSNDRLARDDKIMMHKAG